MKRIFSFSIWGVSFGLVLISLFLAQTSSSYSGVALGLWLLYLMNNAKSFQNNYKPLIFSILYFLYSIQVFYITVTDTWNQDIGKNPVFLAFGLIFCVLIVVVTLSLKDARGFLKSIFDAFRWKK